MGAASAIRALAGALSRQRIAQQEADASCQTADKRELFIRSDSFTVTPQLDSGRGRADKRTVWRMDAPTEPTGTACPCSGLPLLLCHWFKRDQGFVINLTGG